MSIEGTAKTEYASLSGKIHTFVVDKTLSISGACADAKATGDEIESAVGAVKDEAAAYSIEKSLEAVGELAEETARDAAINSVEQLVDEAMAEQTVMTASEVREVCLDGANHDGFMGDDSLSELWSLICNKHDGFENAFVNRYVWEKLKPISESHYTETADTSSTVMGEPIATVTLYYADSFHVDGTMFVLNNPQVLLIETYNWNVPDIYNVILGKYVTTEASSASEMYYYPNDCSITYYNAAYMQASKSIRFTSAYVSVSNTSFGYVNSPNPDAYPVNDGYTYKFLGKLGESNNTEIVSYIGTGLNGINNPCYLTFDVLPDVVIWLGYTDANNAYHAASGNSVNIVCPSLMSEEYTSGSGFCSMAHVCHGKRTDNTISWYGSDEDYQLNSAGNQYYFIAIGRHS